MKLFAAVLFFLLCALQWRLWFGDGAFVEVHALKVEVTKMQENNFELKQRNQTLEAEVLDLKNHLSALEERARNDLGMIQKGETFYQFVQ